MATIELADIVSAQRRLLGLVHRTPILSSATLDRWLGHRLLFKAECLQKVGAFKARGASNMLSFLIERGERPQRVVANSSGNHAQAVAWAAQRFGIPATIFMPSGVSRIKERATRHYGANVVLLPDRKLVDERTAEEAQRAGTLWIPPYDHELIVAGQGTAALEALQEVGKVDAVFAPCGGGGLCSGSLIAAKGWDARTQVIAAEPAAANDAVRSLRSGRIERLSETPKTLADGARTLSVGEVTFPILQQLDAIFEVSEERIVYWTQWLNHLLKVRVEPTSAMVMEAVVSWLRPKQSNQTALVVLTGGNIDPVTARTLWSSDCLDELPAP